MTKTELLNYDQQAVRLFFTTDKWSHKINGVIHKINDKSIIFRPYNGGMELNIAFTRIQSVKQIKKQTQK